jgi:hypothetical protein
LTAEEAGRKRVDEVSRSEPLTLQVLRRWDNPVMVNHVAVVVQMTSLSEGRPIALASRLQFPARGE